ncbi:unnamed protein product [Adineta ricciae]|uniref:Uncharacterized protein n=1 Tax=Adineta ricciae TaxID=249248 RepID=A0A813ZQ95_ADIRI|nr:unnamed protein product [Adineta ricciae]
MQGGFRAAGFIDSSLTSLSTIDIDIADQTNLQLLTAAEFVDIDSSIPAFNEWDDDVHLKELIEISRGDENEQEEEETSVTKKLPNIAKILEMVKAIHLYAIHEQPQLHNALYELESQLIDVYLDSKAIKQSSIKDYFSSC